MKRVLALLALLLALALPTLSFAVPGAPVIPAKVITPAISPSGGGVVGVVLSIPSYAGATYQWLRNGSPISGATSTSYTTVSADGGTTVAVAVTVAGVTVTTSVPVSAFKWLTGSAVVGGSGTSALFDQSTNTITAGDGLFVVIHGTDFTSGTSHISTSNCPSSPAFTAIIYAAPIPATNAATLVCYRLATGTEPTTFSSTSWTTPFARGTTWAYFDYSNGSAVGNSTSNPFSTNSIASGQITATAGYQLVSIVANSYNQTQAVVSPNVGSWSYAYDTTSVGGCTTCGDIYIQDLTLGSSGTTAVQNFTSMMLSADFGNTITFAIVP